MKTFGCLVTDYKLAQQLGLPLGRSQVRVIGQAKSRAAFGRKLIAAGLDRRSPAAVSRWLAEWSSETGNSNELALAASDPDALFACRSLGDHGAGAPVKVTL